MRKRLEHLLALAHQGDQQARDEVFLFLRTRFLVLAKLRVGDDDAEDVLQDAMMIVDRRFAELATAEHLLAFTDGVMRNKIGNFYLMRDSRRRYMVSQPEGGDPTYSIDDELAAAELEDVLRAAIDRLGGDRPRCRALLLGLCEGLSMEDLSRRVGIPRSHIDDWAFRCRQALRRILAKDFGLRF